MLDFPSSPTVGQTYPNPPVAGVATYAWDGEKWTTSFIDSAYLLISAKATAADYRANVADKWLSPDGVWGAAALVTLTDGATVTPNFNAGFDFTWTLGAVGRTLANPTNAKIGQKGILYLVQDATGSRTITTWGSAWKFPGGTKPTLSTAANSVDAISYVVMSSSVILCSFSAAFA